MGLADNERTTHVWKINESFLVLDDSETDGIRHDHWYTQYVGILTQETESEHLRSIV